MECLDKTQVLQRSRLQLSFILYFIVIKHMFCEKTRRNLWLSPLIIEKLPVFEIEGCKLLYVYYMIILLRQSEEYEILFIHCTQ